MTAKMLDIVDHAGKSVSRENLKDEIKILFTDIDGTLLNSDNKLSPLNMQTLIKAKEKGIKIVFATGRPIFSVQGVIGEELKKNDLKLFPGIYLNGCITYGENGEKIIDHIISDELKMDIHNFTKKKKFDQYCIWYTADKTFCFSINEEIRNYMNVESVSPEVITEATFKTLKVYKVLMCLNEQNISSILQSCKDLFAHKINVANTFMCYIELFHQKTNKFEGVKKICDNYNISLNNALAIGDGENDMEMLEGVPTSVAPSNASDKVKKCAKYIGPSNNDGVVSHALQTFCGVHP
ncbi:Haloacid dehalogenase-like hydrolase [Plasmodium coatneyi]|uniref:Haloacid dehalogenase-like hydrolase n=1 Tax=Plasmodium coatneyi TaxID=208452 RepID=A0A1B1DWN2_9APIC|nr:Haloacid dehalogenase-like hydrolase [Plasmodium coatneyi]ANQ07203.1 Haloacid dehalogenase-like hydrolase [Plasmodium coatneyi]